MSFATQNPQLVAQLITQAAQTSVLLVQGIHADKTSGADKKTIAKDIFAQLLAGLLPSLPAVLVSLIAGPSVQAGYAATVTDGTYAQATAAATATLAAATAAA